MPRTLLARLVVLAVPGTAAASSGVISLYDLGSSGMTTHANRVHHITTVTQVAKDIGEDEDWLREIGIEMEIEDGVIWVYGVGEDGVKAFTDFGIENLIELIKFYKENPQLLSADIMSAVQAGWVRTYRRQDLKNRGLSTALIVLRLEVLVLRDLHPVEVRFSICKSLHR